MHVGRGLEMDATKEQIAARLAKIVDDQGTHLDSALIAAVAEIYPEASPAAWAATVKVWRARVFHVLEEIGGVA